MRGLSAAGSIRNGLPLEAKRTAAGSVRNGLPLEASATGLLVEGLAGFDGGFFAVVGVFDFFEVAFFAAADEAFGVALELVPVLANVG